MDWMATFLRIGWQNSVEYAVIEQAVEEGKRTFVSRSNLGISFVIPAYKLHEILFGEELVNRRKLLTETK
jgi:hypothetical protein